ncbi:uncharacterized protein LOC117099943 [Anneissia japonica]|uniref:uncharacterized protein LOC117099943 n=1 Tax=Anneissia japonica TaxID=1529436 RepID=UPI001425BA4A|nr:uncharacterized protein LOC117099943 [Anneissia japonica]XP_033095352.1 uncharacterized protein LOC117099943 [Anneissia japonica]XP_033095353.1 uncharacterized protein LOC117099943 [Anneissia japonica]XP_033095354.1 uncharacterized protein LOC117099943 [Anneissia japonica]
MSVKEYVIYQYYTKSSLGAEKNDLSTPCARRKDCEGNVNMNQVQCDPESSYSKEPSFEEVNNENDVNDDVGKSKPTDDVRPACSQEESDYPDFEQSVAVRFYDYLAGKIEVDEACAGGHFSDTEQSVVRFIDYLAGKIQADEVISGRLSDTASSLDDSIPGHYSELIKRDHLMHLQKKLTKSFSDFEEFLRKVVPSKLNRHGWIVLAPGDVLFHEEFITFSDAYKEWEVLLEENACVNFPLIRNLATKHNIFSGKWMIFRRGLYADLTWIRIARAHREGKLGVAARISLIPENEEMNQIDHVIFVYNYDFRDRKAVFELESKLRNIGIRCRMLYKPLVFTYCDILSKNEWGMKPYIYMSTYDVKITQSTIVKTYDYAYDWNDDDDYDEGKHDGGNNQ